MISDTIKVAFFGTSDRSIPILNSLKANFDLVLCVTREDAKVGRKQELKETQVKTWAKENGIKYYEVSKLDTNCAHDLANALKTAHIDIGVVADFSFILPDQVINTPQFKLINIHFSLLPKYRGASPVQFALLNGDTKTGITYYVMDKNMDTGPIITQIDFPILGTDTSGELYKKMFEEAALNLPKAIKDYVSGSINPTEQDNTKASYTYSASHPKSTHIYKEDAKLDWKAHVNVIERQIRAYNPWPIAWSTLKDMSEIFRIKSNKDLNLKVKIYEANVQNNKINIQKLQVEGGNVLNWKEFENGYLDSAAA